MSFSFSVPASDKAGFAATADEARANADLQYNPDGAPLADKGIEIAKQVVASGMLDNGAQIRYAASISGHGEPADGKGLNSLSINVYNTTA